MHLSIYTNMCIPSGPRTVYKDRIITKEAAVCRTVLSQMERLNILREEYQQLRSRLSFPLSLGERRQLQERSQEILAEARGLALSLNVAGDHWLRRDA